MKSRPRFVAPLVPLLLATLPIVSLVHAQSDPKSPRSQTVAPSVVAQDLTPHAGMVIAGQVVIGQSAPVFELDGSAGRPIQLASLRGDWTALLFMPSLDQALELSETERALHAARIQLVGICHERARSVESFAQRHALAWLLLADVTGEVGAMYGVWDAVQRGYQPGLVLLDTHGIVRYAAIGIALSPEQIREIVLEAREINIKN